MMKKAFSVLTGLLLIAIFIMSGCGSTSTKKNQKAKPAAEVTVKVEKNSTYTS